MSAGLENFIRLEVLVLTGNASPEELEKYREVKSLAEGHRTGIVFLLREAIESDRAVIEIFPNLLKPGAREVDEDLYAAREGGMHTLLGDLSRIITEMLCE